MTLSQIIARDSHYDREIPLEGYWDVWVKIENGKVSNVKITIDIREADKKWRKMK